MTRDPGSSPGEAAAEPVPPVSRPAPPTVRGPLAIPARPPRWPLVIGTVCVVIGVVGVLYSLLQIAIVRFFMGDLLAWVPGQAATASAMEKWKGPMTLVLSAAGAFSIMLGVGGVLLCQRRTVARTVLIIWAVLRLSHAGVQLVVQGLQQADQLAAMSSANVSVGLPGASQSAMIGATAVFWGLILAAWPTFVLIWFMRGRVRRYVSSWQVETAPAQPR